MENQLKEAFRYLVDTGREIADKAVETPKSSTSRVKPTSPTKGELRTV
jgi:hypothetical protein